MPNGHRPQRMEDWREYQDYQRQQIPQPPSFPPQIVMLPEKRSFVAKTARGCLVVVVVIFFCFVVLPWLITLFALIWAPVKNASNTATSFFDGVDPYVRRWLPTWTVAAIAGLVIGAMIRLLRRI